MKRSIVNIATAVLATPSAASVRAAQPGQAATIERGRYLVQISGCNDCHTPGYPGSVGKLPESEWLVGSPVGLRIVISSARGRVWGSR